MGREGSHQTPDLACRLGSGTGLSKTLWRRSIAVIHANFLPFQSTKLEVRKENLNQAEGSPYIVHTNKSHFPRYLVLYSLHYMTSMLVFIYVKLLITNFFCKTIISMHIKNKSFKGLYSKCVGMAKILSMPGGTLCSSLDRRPLNAKLETFKVLSILNGVCNMAWGWGRDDMQHTHA